MNIFDCTLRDGANVVGCGFSAELTHCILKILLNHGILDIEMGHAKGLSAGERSGHLAPLSDREYLELAQPYTSLGRIGMFQLAKLANPNDIHLAKEFGLHFLRVGASAGDGKNALSAIAMVKHEGLLCRYSLMKSYLCTPEELSQEALMLQNAGVDRITIMDSAGTMSPLQTAEYVYALKSTLSIPVGFHGHSNLGLSQANALAAVHAGADEIDGGLLGMARSAGNCSTELAIATLQKEGLLTEIDLYSLLDRLDDELIPSMKEHGYSPAVSPTELILGLTGCHSSTLPLLEKAATHYNLSLRRLISKVSELDRKAPTEELIRMVAQGMKTN